LRAGEAIAGRFAAVGDPAAVADSKSLWRRLWRDEGPEIGEDELWVRGVDQVSGAPVRMVPRAGRIAWGEDVRREAVARTVMALGLPVCVPVLHAGPGVVYAEPAAAGRWPSLSVAQAAECTLAVCEAVAHLHAAGCGEELQFGPGNLRICGDGRVAWVVPGVSTLATVDEHRLGQREALEEELARTFGRKRVTDDWYLDPVRRALWSLTGVFFGLTSVQAAARAGAPAKTLATVFQKKTTTAEVTDVAGLGRVLLALVEDPAGWAERVARLPAVPVVPRLRYDWDAIVADGEALMATPPEDRFVARHPEYVTVPLAAAYHQRASRIFNNSGDAAGALGDARLAVKWDATASHRTTRAVILEATGELAAARAEIDAAFATAPLTAPGEEEYRYVEPLEPPELARAFAARGSIALRERAFAQAEEDLRRAWELDRRAEHAIAFAAALYSRGHVQAAAELEAEAALLAPAEPRHRWALLLSLIRLRRFAEARAQAEVLIGLAPGVYEERLARVPWPG
jgi:tetratricopeptide (TPR) repeat protein